MNEMISILEASGFAPFRLSDDVLALLWRNRFENVVMELHICRSSDDKMYHLLEDGAVIFRGRTTQQVADVVWNKSVQLFNVLDH